MDATPGATAGHEVVLLIAHGSRNPDAKVAHEQLCAELAGRSGADVRAAYLEIDEPSIPVAIDRAVADQPTRIRLVPYFLHPGNHVAHDIPQAAAEAAERHATVPVVVEPHVGADPALLELVARRLSSS